MLWDHRTDWEKGLIVWGDALSSFIKDVIRILELSLADNNQKSDLSSRPAVSEVRPFLKAWCIINLEPREKTIRNKFYGWNNTGSSIRLAKYMVFWKITLKPCSSYRKKGDQPLIRFYDRNSENLWDNFPFPLKWMTLVYTLWWISLTFIGWLSSQQNKIYSLHLPAKHTPSCCAWERGILISLILKENLKLPSWSFSPQGKNGPAVHILLAHWLNHSKMARILYNSSSYNPLKGEEMGGRGMPGYGRGYPHSVLESPQPLAPWHRWGWEGR